MSILDNLERAAYPDHREADQSVQGNEDDEDCVGGLELGPEEDGVYVVPHVVHGEHQEDTHHHHAHAPHHNVGDATSAKYILSAPEMIRFCSLHRQYPHFLFTVIDFIRLARFITMFMAQVLHIKDEMKGKA